jgi:flagellar hook-length control protein FliK
MSLGQCSCPDCGTILRIRERSFVGRTVPCPECHLALSIEWNDEQQVVARKPHEEKPTATKKGFTTSTSIVIPTDEPATDRQAKSSPTKAKASPFRVTPLMMAWALGMAMTTLIVVTLTRPAVRGRSTSSPSKPTVAHGIDNESVANTNTMPSEEDSTNQHVAPVNVLAPSNTTDLLPIDALRPENAPELTHSFDVEVVAGNTASTPDNPAVASPASVQPPNSVVTPPKIEWDQLLKQRFDSFEQATPTSRRELIEFIEELLGAPIRINPEELGEQSLNQRVTVRRLESPQLGTILKSVLDPNCGSG